MIESLGTIKLFNDKQYIAIPDDDDQNCGGCCFLPSEQCYSFRYLHGECHRTIAWKEIAYPVEKYTVDVMLRAIAVAYPSAPQFDAATIESTLKKLGDPRYAEYLKLKEIFE